MNRRELFKLAFGGAMAATFVEVALSLPKPPPRSTPYVGYCLASTQCFTTTQYDDVIIYSAYSLPAKFCANCSCFFTSEHSCLWPIRVERYEGFVRETYPDGMFIDTPLKDGDTHALFTLT